MTHMEMFADCRKMSCRTGTCAVHKFQPLISRIQNYSIFFIEEIEKKKDNVQLGTVNKVQCSLYACWHSYPQGTLP